jgi:hypothetical protein
MKKSSKLVWLIRGTVVLSIVMLYFGCGGGGGGGGGGGAIPEEYIGKTSEAPITYDNAQTIMVSAYSSGMSGQSVGGVMGAQAGESSGGFSMPLTVINSLPFKNLLNKGLLFKTASKTTEPPDHGECGGTSTITYTGEKVGDTADMVFDNYCEYGFTINGKIHMTLVSDSDVSSKVSAVFTNVTVKTSCLSVTESGTMDMETTDTYTRYTYKYFTCTNNTTHKTTMMNDYVATITDGDYNDYGSYSYPTLTESGTYYYPDYGYVTISTPVTLKIGSYGVSSGVLKAVGADGSTATITFSNGAYSISIDDNGDGSFTKTIDGEVDSGC